MEMKRFCAIAHVKRAKCVAGDNTKHLTVVGERWTDGQTDSTMAK
jgi:hypothetical protein